MYNLRFKGSLLFSKKEKIFKKSIKLNVVNASGAGDAFMAGFSYGLFNDESVEECLNLAMASSRIVLKSKTASPHDYNLEKLMEEVKMLDKENLKKYVEFSPEVKDALENNKPVVALESTIISHGMPYPKNLQTAKECEEIIRKGGAVPATTAIINGKIKVGLTEEELEFLSTSKDVIKTSRRDFAYIVSQGLNGATTVASTIIIAKLAGIKILLQVD